MLFILSFSKEQKKILQNNKKVSFGKYVLMCKKKIAIFSLKELNICYKCRLYQQ